MTVSALTADGVATVAASLPEPNASWTVPVIVVCAVLVLFALVRKVIGLAILAAIVAGVFIAYQGGAFDHWIDKGKDIVKEHTPTLPTK